MKLIKRILNFVKSWRRRRQFKKKIKNMDIKDPFIYK